MLLLNVRQSRFVSGRCTDDVQPFKAALKHLLAASMSLWRVVTSPLEV